MVHHHTSIPLTACFRRRPALHEAARAGIAGATRRECCVRVETLADPPRQGEGKQGDQDENAHDHPAGGFAARIILDVGIARREDQ